MNEQLPYEDELLKRMQELPVPNEDDSWEDMKRLLDEDDKQPPVVALPLKGCGRYGILLLALLLTGLLTADPFKWFHPSTGDENNQQIGVEKSGQPQKDTVDIFQQPRSENPADPITKNGSPVVTKEAIMNTSNDKDSSKKKQAGSRKNPVEKSNQANQQRQLILPQNEQTKKAEKYTLTKSKTNNQHKLTATSKKTKGSLQSNSSGALAVDSTEAIEEKTSGSDSLQKSTIAVIQPGTLSTTAPANDSLTQKPVTAISKTNKKDSTTKKVFNFSAGIGLQQLIPIAGQQTNPYNALGRKNTWGDYIPSIYVRLTKDKKWFLQSGLRYGAPQYTKDIIFKQQKTADSANVTLTTNNSRVKKTFYHQLPISFHHYISKGFSIGAGVQLNKFTSAVVEHQQLQSSVFNPVDTILSSITRHQKKADTNFVKMYLQGLIETQYHYKRFSGGLSYSFGLQPYLKFTLPGGEQKTASNRSLQLFIRYQLWKQ